MAFEHEALAFASESLTPASHVGRRCFALLREHPIEAELSEKDRVKRLAGEFGVDPSAIRVRLEHMKLTHLLRAGQRDEHFRGEVWL